VQDPHERRVPGLGLGRDPARTPMQWGEEGFSAAEPWLPYADDHATVNVAAQRDDPGSLLSLYRRLLAARREFALAPYRTLSVDGDVLAYARGDRVSVALNLGEDEQAVALRGRVLAATHASRTGDDLGGETRLRGGEGLVVLSP
jgi:alpha-glucosidase